MNMSYLFIKHLHLSVAVLSLSLFIIRFMWSIHGSPMLNQRWVKVCPHIIDTLLLSLGVYLMISLKFWPTEHPWMASKLIALLAYIVLGMFAIKRAKTRGTKYTTGVLAILVFIYMVNVAISKNPLIFM